MGNTQREASANSKEAIELALEEYEAKARKERGERTTMVVCEICGVRAKYQASNHFARLRLRLL
jgi:predicted molibdopterin-dependent oxidoreductase YjgC